MKLEEKFDKKFYNRQTNYAFLYVIFLIVLTIIFVWTLFFKNLAELKIFLLENLSEESANLIFNLIKNMFSSFILSLLPFFIIPSLWLLVASYRCQKLAEKIADYKKT
ncbi:hypothetical protein [Cellvibrio japonicus]|uniref:Uncharacterized protein n=1 Tax=Cellvibrio japonicus (strain Ueda107) TaxID=498211 RepID=B3PHE3_CELJU|nr:hypothetical protein [Cellvibrio japonicus]ACE85362.1 hypothetical protein CJA_0340 [Cellvibrio japonicus Ueda107]